MNIEHEIALIERVNYSWRHKFCTKITSISDQINRYAIIPQTIFPQQIFRTHESEILNHWKSRKVLTFEEQNRHGDVGLHVEEERRITRCVKRYHRTTKLLLHYKNKSERISWIFCLFTTDCDRSGLERQFGWEWWLGNCWKLLEKFVRLFRKFDCKWMWKRVLLSEYSQNLIISKNLTKNCKSMPTIYVEIACTPRPSSVPLAPTATPTVRFIKDFCLMVYWSARVKKSKFCDY